MNAVRAGRVGDTRIQLLQLAGALDVIVAVVGEYPTTWGGDRRFDQMVVHVLADPQAASGHLPADQYQFTIEGPSSQAQGTVERFKKEHSVRKRYRDCTSRCRHAPLPSLYPNLNWTFEKGLRSYDRRRAQFGYTSELEDALVQAPDAGPVPGYEAALQRLKVVVAGVVARGLCDLRILISATNPLTLPPHRFSDPRVWEQQVLVNRCIEVCQEIDDQLEVQLRNVDSLRNFAGPTNSLRNWSYEDHVIPAW